MEEVYSTYLNFQSPELQNIWHGNYYFLSKVVRIAWTFFSHTISTFFQNQALWIKGFFTNSSQSESHPQQSESHPLQSESHPLPSIRTEKNRTVRILPYLGIFTGLMSGFSARLLTGITFDQKFNCRKMGGALLFPLVNKIKQWELKNFALLPLTIPFFYNVYRDVRKESAEKPLFQRVKSAIRRQFSTKEFLLFAITSTLALTNPLYSRPLGLSTRSGFDSSGHIMLKTVLAPMMAITLGKTAQTNPQLALAAALIYSVTDAIFLYNTSHLCHTAYETLAGGAWALAILTPAFASQFWTWSNKEKTI